MEKKDWDEKVFQVAKKQWQDRIKHQKKLQALGLIVSNTLLMPTDDEILGNLAKKLDRVRKFVYQYCPSLAPKRNLDLTTSLKLRVDYSLQRDETIQKHLREYPLYDRKTKYGVDKLSSNDKSSVDVFCSRLLQGIQKELQFALEKRLLLDLSKVPIGGNEQTGAKQRVFDVTPFFQFAVQHSLEAESPETIFKAHADAKWAQANAGEEEEIEQFQLLPRPVQPEPSIPRQLTASGQLCVGSCSIDKSRHGTRLTCKTNPYGPFGLYEWDFCDQ